MASSPSAGAETLTQRDTIVIASEPDYPPYCFIDENGKAAGFAIDLFTAATKAVDLEFEIRIGIWSKIKQDLADGKIDALPLVGRTPEREADYDFTLPYMSLHGAVFVRKGTRDILSLDDLRNKSVLVMKGDNAEEFARRESISNDIVTTNTFEEAFISLSSGHHDAVITQRITGINLLKKLKIKNVKALDFHIPQFRQDFCFAVQKGNTALLAKLDEGLSIIIANDTYEEIRYNWFGPTESGKQSVIDALLLSVYIFVPLIIIMAIVMIMILRKQVKKQTNDLRREIFEHKNTLESLHKQNLLLKEMERVTMIGGWEYDVKNNRVSWTDGAYPIYGVSKDHYDPSNYNSDVSFFTQEDQHILDNAFKRALKTGESYNLELRLKTPAGIEKWVRTIGHAELSQGKVIRLYGNIADITEKKKAHDELQSRERQNRLLLNSTAEGIYGIDMNGKCTFCNTAALNILGYEKENDVIGKNMHDLIHHGHPDGSPLPIESCKIFHAFNKGQKTHSDEEILWRANRTSFPAEYFSHPIAEDGKVIGAVVTFWDISERMKARQDLIDLKESLENQVKQRTAELHEKLLTLNKSQKAMLYMIEDLNQIAAELKAKKNQLETSNAELEAFTYSVSHDLRAPLRAIDGFSTFLIEDYYDQFDEEGKRLINVIRKNTKKMDQLITDLLNLSRVSRTELNYTEVNIQKMVSDIFNETATVDQKNAFTFNMKELPPAFADQRLIAQVWQNLIDNALKYSSNSQHKYIEIGAKNDETMIRYYIKDKGAGFNPKYIDKLFGVFQRLHNEEEFEGNGIGLAIVKRIITHHGGEVFATGNPDQGAIFHFSLPKINKNEGVLK
jgi:PAS domain S-box-containing protein